MELDCKLTPAPEMVVLRELETSDVSEGGFYLSEHALSNSRSAFCKVEAIGSVAKKETGLNPGDFVYADKLASHYHTSPVCVMKWDAIFLITDESKGNLKSLPGWALLTETTSDEQNTGFIVEDPMKIRHGTVKSINYGVGKDPAECPFAVGDDVMITRKCDVLDGFGDEGKLVSMKIEEIVARFDHGDK